MYIYQNATQPEAVYDDFKKNNTTGGRDTLQKAAFSGQAEERQKSR